MAPFSLCRGAMAILRKRVRSAELTTIAGGALPTGEALDYPSLSPEGITNEFRPRTYLDIIYDHWPAVETARMEAEQNYREYRSLAKEMAKDPLAAPDELADARALRNEWKQVKENIGVYQDINEMQLYLDRRPIPTRAETFRQPAESAPDLDLDDAPSQPNSMYPTWIANGSPETEAYASPSLTAANNYMYSAQNSQNDYAYFSDPSTSQSYGNYAQTSDAAFYNYNGASNVVAGGDLYGYPVATNDAPAMPTSGGVSYIDSSGAPSVGVASYAGSSDAPGYGGVSYVDNSGGPSTASYVENSSPPDVDRSQFVQNQDEQGYVDASNDFDVA